MGERGEARAALGMKPSVPRAAWAILPRPRARRLRRVLRAPAPPAVPLRVRFGARAGRAPDRRLLRRGGRARLPAGRADSGRAPAFVRALHVLFPVGTLFPVLA